MTNQQALRNSTFLTLIMSFCASYVGLCLSIWSDVTIPKLCGIWLGLALLVASIGRGYYKNAIHQKAKGDGDYHDWALQIGLGFFLCLFLFTILVHVITGITGLFFPDFVNALDENQYRFWGDLYLAMFATILGIIQSRQGPKLERVRVPIKNLHQEFRDFKIVQISDLHVSALIGQSYVENVVKKTNALLPDLVVLTGDFVDGTVTQLKHIVSHLSHLKSKHGILFITGNHEYYWGADQWVKHYQGMGFTTLLNQHIVLKKNSGQLVVGGVTDIMAGKMLEGHASDVSKAFENAPADVAKILLAHQPNSYKQALQEKVDLQISGHTHGGQFFPGNLFVKLAQKFFKGLYKHEGMWIYVSRGTGFWGPPLRFLVPCELTEISLDIE